MIRSALSLAGCMVAVMTANACYSGGGNNCFPAGTLIQTPSGDARVETLRIGEEVLALDAATGKEIRAHVVKTYVHHHDAQLERLTLANGAVLQVTPEHPLFSVTRHGWVTAGAIAKGEQLQVRDGKGGVTAAELVTTASEKNDEDVYNLETDAGNYFAEGIVAKYY